MVGAIALVALRAQSLIRATTAASKSKPLIATMPIVRAIGEGLAGDQITRVVAILNGTTNAVLSQMGITDAREKSVSFTSPVTFNGVVVVGPKGSAITEDPATMKGKTIGVQSGTIEEVWANKTLKGIATVKSYDGQDQAFQDLQAQRIDATVCDQPVAYDFLRKGGKAESDYLGKPLVDPATLGSGNTAMAVRKDDTKLRDTLNAAITQVLKDGSFAKVNAEYFPFSMAPKS